MNNVLLMSNKIIWQFTCKQCKYKWVSRDDTIMNRYYKPKRCARCHIVFDKTEVEN